MALLFLESTGPNGPRLAEEAGGAVGAVVGIDPDTNDVTIDSDAHGDEAELRDAITGALAGLDPDWESQLRIAD